MLPQDYYIKMNEIEKELRKSVIDWNQRKFQLIPIPKAYLFDQILIRNSNHNSLFLREYQV